MLLVDDILLSPVTLTVWLAEKFKEHVEGELYNVTALKLSLEELRERREDGEITEEEFLRNEEKILNLLQAAVEYEKSKPAAGR